MLDAWFEVLCIEIIGNINGSFSSFGFSSSQQVSPNMSCQEHPLIERIKHISPFSIHWRRTARVRGEMTKVTCMLIWATVNRSMIIKHTRLLLIPCYSWLVVNHAFWISWFSTIPGYEILELTGKWLWGGRNCHRQDHFYEAHGGIDGRNRASHSPSPQNEWTCLVWGLVGILVGICACCFLVIFGVNILAHSIGFDAFCCTVMVFFQPSVDGSHWLLVRSCKCKSVVTPKISKWPQLRS